jgi:PAS domain S-box-containing protein
MADIRLSDLEADLAGPPPAAPAHEVHPHARLALAVLLVGVGYYGAGIAAFSLQLGQGGISDLWLPHGVMLAALMLAPPRYWWLYLAALLPVHLHLATHFQGPVSLPVILVHFAGNAVQALLGAMAVRRFIGAPPRLDALRPVTVFLTLGLILPVVVAAALVSGLFVVTGAVDDFGLVWRRRTLAGVCGAIALTPLIVVTASHGTAAIRAVARERKVEFAVLTVGLLLLVGWERGLIGQQALLFTPLPLLLWTAVRFGPGGLSLQLLIVVLAALTATRAGEGPFVAASAAERVLFVQAYVLSISISLLLLAALVAERDRSRQALQASEKRYREVVESQTELVCRYLPDTTLTFVNDAYCRFFGREREVLIGRKFVELIPEPAREAVLAQVASLVADPRVHTYEHEVLLADGTICWQQWVDSPVCAQDGRVTEVQGIGRDITDRKRAEAAHQRLAQASRLAAMGELTASIAHEINQPLGAILFNADAAELLLRADPGRVDEVRKILADIRKDDLRASEVVRRIRELLRTRALEREPLDLNEVASGVLDLLRADAARRGVALEVDLAPGLPAVPGDRVYLQQVLLNLFLNAMEAMAETPAPHRRLSVRTARNASGVEVSVTDAGPGVPPERLPRLFESFFTTKKDGMGLGLSIARSIVEAHGGRIWAETRAEGATFRFTVPAEPAA